MTVFATKGNLIKAKRSLRQARLGYDLMDRKRNILVREMMALTDDARILRDEIDRVYSEAYRALEYSNMTLGINSSLAQTFPVENSLKLSSRSVMGVELPKISAEIVSADKPPYSMTLTSSEFDKAFIKFNRVKEITVRLAEIENSIYRLANAIKKTQKRANALKNIIIPEYEQQVKYISNALEEKEHEEFSRQKVIKYRKLK